ncbi:membrane-associated progesterone receptor component-related [Holotrichia oblita]|uniref:Membrane-associated progesterone receptor component-related n=2 Tax=Holotrichia oblita TaxID=644536 RepID=A0ACB9T2A9_HOLOL|nr:membrane-associated progesterone receptor component-related [Holotrichia oblita]KAI4460911.1 membrane-associated progesterone receptor component-related [Holotrichia oblita]
MLKYFCYTAFLTFFISVFYNYSYFDYIKKYIYYNKNNSKKLFSPEELRSYNGEIKQEIYLALLGNVFDVTKGAQHYGSGQTYNVFVGRDASRNFIDGKFNDEDISDDIIGLDDKELLSLDKWLKFYKKEYKKVGLLIGKHYDDNGSLTQYGKEVRSLIKKAYKAQGNEDALKKKYPPCNIEYDAIKGSRVWCSNRSGGIERDWIGVPRQFYETGSQSYRCACISKEDLNLGNIKEYENCQLNSISCYLGNV